MAAKQFILDQEARECLLNGVAKGILDPTKVVRCALQNAASAAGPLVTTESAVTDIPQKNKPVPASHGMDHDY